MSDTSSEVEWKKAVVIDNGSGSVKCGWAGHKGTEAVVGAPALARRDELELAYPLAHGKVENWDDLEKIWEYCFFQGLEDFDPEAQPVLLTEAPLNPLANRNKMAQIMFEHFNVPALYVVTQAIMPLYASGRMTGVVLDSGDGVTHVVPVVDGFAIQHAVDRLDLGGRDVTEYLANMLSDKAAKSGGKSFTTPADKDIVKEIKEKHCYVAADFEKEEAADAFPTVPYRLPDGTVIQLGKELIKAPECMLRPDLVGLEKATSRGMSEMIFHAISKCALDNKKELYANIVLSGGNTLFRGLEERVKAHVTKQAPDAVKIKVVAPPERQFSVWIGASIAANLSTQQWVSKLDWQEEGPHVLHRDSADGRHTGY